MTLTSISKAVEYFRAKTEFSTGPAELSLLIEADENINIIDVRKPDDFDRGHIPGAVNVPRESWESFEGMSPDKVNVIYCYSHVCHLAAQGALYFAENDYPVLELDGGFEEWQRQGLPVES